MYVIFFFTVFFTALSVWWYAVVFIIIIIIREFDLSLRAWNRSLQELTWASEILNIPLHVYLLTLEQNKLVFWVMVWEKMNSTAYVEVRQWRNAGLSTEIVLRRVQHTTKRSVRVIISCLQSTSRVVFLRRTGWIHVQSAVSKFRLNINEIRRLWFCWSWQQLWGTIINTVSVIALARGSIV